MKNVFAGFGVLEHFRIYWIVQLFSFNIDSLIRACSLLWLSQSNDVYVQSERENFD
jgi:hypothetical protein